MRAKHYKVALLALCFMALCLRAPISVLGPLESEISSYFKLSATAFGALSAMPVFIFGIFALFAPFLSVRRSITAALLFIIFGLFLRSFFGTSELFVGSFILGIGIALLNVIAPAFIKEKFTNIPRMMSIYSGVMGISVLLGVLAHYSLGFWGLKGALSCWLIFAVLAFFAYLPFLANKRYKRTRPKGLPSGLGSVLRKKGAWIIMAFLGIQSCIFYTIIAWYAAVVAASFDARVGANLTFLMQAVAMVSSFLMPQAFGKSRRKDLFVIIACSFNIFGFLFLTSSSLSLLALAGLCFSVTTGGVFGIALIFIATKARREEVLALSSMSQSLGYVLAGFGPLIFGYLKDLTGDFNAGLYLMSFLSLLLLYLAKKSENLRLI